MSFKEWVPKSLVYFWSFSALGNSFYNVIKQAVAIAPLIFTKVYVVVHLIFTVVQDRCNRLSGLVVKELDNVCCAVDLIGLSCPKLRRVVDRLEGALRPADKGVFLHAKAHVLHAASLDEVKLRG